MPRLRITTLGSLTIVLDDTLLTRFESDKARALLVYLAIENTHPHRRERLLTLFWPELSDQPARKNLSRTLYRLRQTLKEGTTASTFFHIDRHTLQLNPASPCWIDVQAFREPLHQATQIDEPARSLALLQHAAELYQGDFLAGVSLVDSEEFETWALHLRNDMHSRALVLFEQLVIQCRTQGQDQAAQLYAQRLVALDPLREASHRLLMQTFAAIGDRTAALQQYEMCCSLLQQELGLQPEPATTALYEQIRHGTRTHATSPITASLSPEAVARHAPACPYPGLLPFETADAWRFFGRTADSATLVERLCYAPLQAVIGPSGSGKSSLVFAGLIPALQRHAAATGRTFLIRSMRPGTTPLQMLATTLADTSAHTVFTKEPQLADLPPPSESLLLIVDQFEEVFTIGSSEVLAFQQMLLWLTEQAVCSVVLTMRADFYPNLMVSPLWTTLREQRTEIVPLDATGLRQAILRPAEAVGVEIETALVERLIADGANAPGVLPLVQETLTLLWQHLAG
ncbi:MAG: hypothetical protein HC876_20220, partial [Chloroflexaceae bacterium]|nr:hypothetical protein [Chloroflexaceae bacterium]